MYRHIEKDEKKLTDEEIVKALECCAVEPCEDCGNCYGARIGERLV